MRCPESLPRQLTKPVCGHADVSRSDSKRRTAAAYLIRSSASLDGTLLWSARRLFEIGLKFLFSLVGVATNSSRVRNANFANIAIRGIRSAPDGSELPGRHHHIIAGLQLRSQMSLET